MDKGNDLTGVAVVMGDEWQLREAILVGGCSYSYFWGSTVFMNYNILILEVAYCESLCGVSFETFCDSHGWPTFQEGESILDPCTTSCASF